MKEELLPILIIIGILIVLYLFMKLINRKLKKRVSKSRYRGRRKL